MKFLVCTIVMFKGKWLLLVVISLWQCQCTSFSSPSHITWPSQGKRENISAQRWKAGLSFSPSVDCIAKQTWSFTPGFYSQPATQAPLPAFIHLTDTHLSLRLYWVQARRKELPKKWLLVCLEDKMLFLIL